MKEYSELKRLAENATPGEWSHEQDNLYFYEDGYTRHMMELSEGSDIGYVEQKHNSDFIAAANPEVILELIAEVEALKAERDYCRRVADHNLDLGVQYMNERDQAKTDNELLRAEINHLKPCPLYSTRMNSTRYLWLRDSHIGDDPESINLECGPNNGLNSAIDAAMSNKD